MMKLKPMYVTLVVPVLILVTLVAVTPAQGASGRIDNATPAQAADRVGRPSALITPDGKQADLYVSANEVPSLLEDLKSNPDAYLGLSIVVEILSVRPDPSTEPGIPLPANHTMDCGGSTDESGKSAIGVFYSCGPDSRPVFVRRDGLAGVPLVVLLRAVASAPRAAEAELGLVSPFDDPGAISSATIADGVAIVDLAPRWVARGSLSSLSGSNAVINTLAATATQLPGVEAVEFRVDGSCGAFWGAIGARRCFRVDGRGIRFPLPDTVIGMTNLDTEAFLAATYTDFWPTTWNLHKVFLSVACHDPDLGPDCVDNFYCTWSENTGSKNISFEATLGTAHGSTGYNNLLERQYAVRIGQGGVINNVNWSNAWTTNWRVSLHIPVHTNGAGTGSCPEQPSISNAGTRIFYESSNGSDAANEFVATVGPASPGQNDLKLKSTILYELDPVGVEAVPVYTESEFHSWTTGANWLKTYKNWVWRFGNATDQCFGYPRYSGSPYPHFVLNGTKQCAWAASS